MAPVLPNGILTLMHPNPGHLSSGLGGLDDLVPNASPDDIARALVQRCESALKLMQERMPQVYGEHGKPGGSGWVLRRCEAHVYTTQGPRSFGRDEAVLLFAGIMMGICLYGIYNALFGPATADADEDDSTSGEEGSILLRESESDYTFRPVNHADLHRAVIDEKDPLPGYESAPQTANLPAYTDDPNGSPVPLKRDESKYRGVVGPYDALFVSGFGGPMY